MSIMDKLMFWRKDDPLSDLGGEFGASMGGGPGLGNDHMSQGFTSPNDPLSAPMSEGIPDVSSYKGGGGFDDPMGNTNPRGFSQQPPQVTSPFQQGYTEVPKNLPQGHELEIISAKLDAIKATMDALNQRMNSLEQLYSNQQQQRRSQW
jgi:hypothetical protein